MFDFVTTLIETMGAFGVGVVMLLENLFPPIPSELVMPLAGFSAAQGQMSLAAVFIAGTVGAVLGAVFWYEVGRRLGHVRMQRFIARYGIWLTLDQDDYARAMGWFARHQRAATFYGRMIPGVRTLVSVPAGMAGMPLGQFLLYTTAGSGLWNAGLIASGYLLEANYHRVAEFLDPGTTIVIAIVIGIYLFRVGQHLLRRRKG
ncbi:membrane protein DedA, SNARE-associated domain [Loktanella fryxellensis]|uniref:Membrane protein DedA, SNARE-associated domain n=1 Tax=Loktanella fryxellensis TaxID=245187 RepID=A0A1H8JUS8_9RHOB|nr:DedA family protein [Loktanella fryxellensis]SEN84036.1 membrane protein DedA, SNARE-associated domain [Loktanella fryxellensis]